MAKEKQDKKPEGKGHPRFGQRSPKVQQDGAVTEGVKADSFAQEDTAIAPKEENSVE